MSYILDALKKSEQQRQRGAAPSLLAAQTTDVVPRRPLTLVYGLAAAAILVVGVTIGTLRPWRTEAPAFPQPVVKPPEAVAPAAPPPAPAVAITINTERQATAPASATPPVAAAQPTPAIQPVPAAQPAPATQPVAATQPAAGPAGGAVKAPSVAPASPAQGVAPVSTTAPQDNASSPPPGNPVGARPSDAVPERSPVAFADLPDSVQRDIPKLSILFHLYSRNPKERLVGINDRTLHEGDSVAPGLVVDEITPDGMVLSYKGYRFLHGTR